MKIVRTDLELQTPHVDRVLVDAGHDLVLLPDGASEEDVISTVADADLLLMCYTPISRRVIEAGRKLKGIVKYGVGIDAIDSQAAREHGILVVNVPEYAEETVAEGAFALMIALAKKLPMLDRQMKKEGWAWPEPRWLGTDIAGKTVGIVGLGKIGRSMARMSGDGFRARVVAYDPFVTAQEMSSLRVEKIDNLSTLLQQSDFVSVHSVLTPDTHHLLGEAELRAMKPTAFLINVARGAIVDTDALMDALESGHVAAAALDVTDPEPLPLGHPLWQRSDVIITPHVAGSAALTGTRRTLLFEENMRRFGAGEALLNVVDKLAGY